MLGTLLFVTGFEALVLSYLVFVIGVWYFTWRKTKKAYLALVVAITLTSLIYFLILLFVLPYIGATYLRKP